MEYVELTKGGEFLRDRIPSNSEVESIFSVLDEDKINCFKSLPVGSIIRFIFFTGARVGEVLHAEWSDFDLENG